MRRHDRAKAAAVSAAQLFGLAAIGMLAAGAEAAAASGPVVGTPLGFIQGTSSPTVGPPVQAFLGVRYGDAPAGALRWAPPQFTGSYGTAANPTPAVTPAISCPQNPGEFSDPNPAVSGNGSLNTPVTPTGPGTEACLFLNGWRPASATSSSALPVLFWIHGGALTTGASAGYDPSVMVEENDIIVVTVNYRLAALGWLADAALAATSANAFENVGDAGNYGLMDQQFAMAWVKNNIAAFGGDPSKVTIDGESAGGLSVSLNLASPKTAAGLFRAAIIESGAYMINTVASLAAAETTGAGVAAKILGSSNGGSPQSLPGSVACNNLTAAEIKALTPAQTAACLRLQSISTILEFQGGGSPTSGTLIVPQGLNKAFSSGEFIQVPVMQGTNHDEGRLFEPDFFDPFLGGTPNPIAFVAGGPAQSLIGKTVSGIEEIELGGSPVTFTGELGLLLGKTLATALTSKPLPATVTAPYDPAAFPNPDFNNAPSADEAIGAAYTDFVFACNGLESNRLLAKHVTVYAYEFHDPDAPDLFEPLIGFSYGSSHASELQYLFDPATLQGPFDAAANQSVTVPAGDGPSNAVQPPPLSPTGSVLASEMKTYWANFVKTTSPNGFTTPFWLPFNLGATPIQQLTPRLPAPFTSGDFSNEHNCGFWEPILDPT